MSISGPRSVAPWRAVAFLLTSLGLLCASALAAQTTGPESETPGTRTGLEPRELTPTAERTAGADRRPRRLAPQPAEPQPPDRGPATCGGDSICAAEVDAIVQRAAMSLDTDNLTVVVVDRVGGVLAVFRKPGADPANDDIAVGVARTAAFFSNNFAPLSSRTVRSLSGVNFPIGVKNTLSGGLYSIEQSNRGCDLNVTFNEGQAIPQSKSIEGLRNDLECNPRNTVGCGPGLITGKQDPFEEVDQPVNINPGGVPLFRPTTDLSTATGGLALGAIGVAGPPALQAEFAAFNGAFGAGATAPIPFLPRLPFPGNVFIDGVRLAFVRQTTQPAGTSPDPVLRGAYDPDFLPRNGQSPPEGYLVGPLAGQKLTAAEVDRIVQQSVESANRTRAQVRLPVGQSSRMVIAISDLDGKLLALFRQPDALFDAVDVCPGKARAVVFYSGEGSARLRGVPPGIAITTRALGFGAQIAFPSGQENKESGPFFEDVYVRDWFTYCSIGDQGPDNPNQNGISFIPGGIPLYKGNELVGGLGVSGDGVEQDDIVAFEGAFGFLPAEAIRSDTVVIDGVRLPFLKFPRQPTPRGLGD
ncbi:MAG TPA: heme-binding protein [Thermoanaerobaculia bacterium]|nr:heme-binding protein [Thermoanaerobaculia bacterium]